MQQAVRSAETTPAAPGRNWWTLIAVCGGTFMLLVDVTIVQVALPTIQRQLHASFTDLEWVISAYALTLSALILSSGTLADRFGRKRIFLTGLGLFTTASLLCGLATNTELLILARGAQGFGGAAMFATSLALIAEDYQGKQRGTAIAAWGATVGGAVAVGPLLGGALTDGLGWRWIFFVNIPIGVVTFALASRRIRNVTDPDAKTIDWAGLVTFSVALFLLTLGLVRGNDDGWRSPIIVGLLAGSILLFAVFLVVELRQARPMFDLSLFRKPGFVGVSLATFAIGGGMFGLMPYLTIYLQDTLGYSPFAGGLRLLPSTVLIFLVPLLSRSMVERLAPGLVLGTGLGLTALGLALMHSVAVDSNWTVLLPGLLVGGLGIGIANPAIARIGLGVVPPARSGMASGINNTFRIGGLATGVAALGAIFEGRIGGALLSLRGKPAPGLARTLASGGVRALSNANPHAHAFVAVGREAFVAGLREILFVGAVTVLVGAIAGITLVRRRDFYRPPSAPLPSTGGPELGVPTPEALNPEALSQKL